MTTIIKNGKLRTPCIVPHCGITAPHEPHLEIICRKHWRLTDARLRRRFMRMKRLIKRGDTRTEKLQRLEGLLWKKLKTQALERAMGISA